MSRGESRAGAGVEGTRKVFRKHTEGNEKGRRTRVGGAGLVGTSTLEGCATALQDTPKEETRGKNNQLVEHRGAQNTHQSNTRLHIREKSAKEHLTNRQRSKTLHNSSPQNYLFVGEEMILG